MDTTSQCNSAQNSGQFFFFSFRVQLQRTSLLEKKIYSILTLSFSLPIFFLLPSNLNLESRMALAMHHCYLSPYTYFYSVKPTPDPARHSPLICIAGFHNRGELSNYSTHNCHIYNLTLSKIKNAKFFSLFLFSPTSLHVEIMMYTIYLI